MTRFFNSLGAPVKGAVLMVTAGLLFAVVNTLIQYGTMTYGIPPARFAFWQYLLALILALPWLMRQGRGAAVTGRLPMHLLRVACAVIGVQLWVYGLAHVPIWQAIALIMLSPFFVTLGAWLFLREPVTPARWIAVVLGIGGGMLILAPWSDAFSLFALFPVGAALFWAMTSLATKHLTTTESSDTLTFYLLLLLTPANAVLALGDGVMLDLSVSVWVIVAAGLLTALAQHAIAAAYSTADAAYLQPFDHVKLPFNVGLGFLVFGWGPPGMLWIGAALIVGASLYLLQSESRNAPSKNRPKDRPLPA
ncbi:MAG: DMT family transporter [Pelagimonas sp.]|jgi:S-adenosylmethionine uptake transporter|nr:DMT family transporter [Pelagimonas sp.]